MHYDYFALVWSMGCMCPPPYSLTMTKSLMIIPLSLHFLSNLLLRIIMPCQLGVHLRQRRVLNKIFELKEGMRI
jgi:hypothetical protein